MNDLVDKNNFKLVSTQEISLDHPDVNITIDKKEYTLSFKNVKINIFEEIDEENTK